MPPPTEPPDNKPAAPKMHADEVDAGADVVGRLLGGQFPQWAQLPLEHVDSFGTDHHIYRLGDELAVRLPRIAGATSQAAKEALWLPKLAPHLPLAIPVPVAMGKPAEGYPFDWSVYEWLPGHRHEPNPTDGTIVDLDQVATDLAAFITALRSIDTDGAHARPPGKRGSPLADLNQQFRRSIADLGDRIDAGAATSSWDESLQAPAWAEPEVWLHGDLLPGNLLMLDQRLAAIIDFGGLNVGDPAVDLLPAWNIFSGESRERFRTELQADEASWLRGRGWALYQAVVALPYYCDTNPGMIRQASRALAEVLADG